MLSHDLDNLARALEQVVGELTAEKVCSNNVPSENVFTNDVTLERASFLTLVCNNLYSLALQAEMLERVPTIDSVHVSQHAQFLQ